MKPADLYPYSVAEEVANSITHGVGAVLSFAGMLLLVGYAAMDADPYRIVGMIVFGTTLLLLYVASTLYHAVPHEPVKRAMRICDHCAIYLLIAGTYTPFLLVSMRGPLGYSLLAFLWLVAAAGCCFKIFFTGYLDRLSTIAYVVMGWTIIVALKPALAMVPTGAMVLMGIGGLAYTTGVAFYVWDRLPYNHAIWHLFVLAGSITHFFAIYYFVLPLPKTV